MHSSGIRGMCPQCLFACSTVRFDAPTEVPLVSEDDEELASDRRVGPKDRFLLLDKLGEGGMGEVWLAEDRELSQPGEPQFVALKFLSKSIRHNSRAEEAVRAEVRRSQKLTHPNIVRINDLHTTRAGLPFINMEFVEGNSLSHWLRNHPGRVMPWRLVTLLTRQLASALVYAHETAGIVHRDLKPANLLLADGNMVKLSDFGLSQALRGKVRPGDEPGGGTLAYAGPQQISGAPPSPADDVYSLGATLYELLSGTPPFQADYMDDLLEKIHNATPEPIPQRLQGLGRQNEVPARLLLLVQRCLEKDPIYRPKTSELARLLPLVDEPRAESRGRSQAQVELESKPSRASGWADWFWTSALFLVLLVIAAWVFDVAQTRERVQRALQTLSDYLVDAGGNNTDRADTSEATPPAPPPPSNAPPVQAVNPLSPVPKGRLSLQIDSASAFTFYDCEVQGGDGAVRFAWRLPQIKTINFPTNLPVGEYVMKVTAGGSATATEGLWTLRQPLLISAEATSVLRFPFRKEILTIQSVPPKAIIHWTNAYTSNVLVRLGAAPYSDLFRSGTYEFTAELQGHRLLTTNLFFDPQPGSPQQLLLQLQRQVFPVAGEDWTNSLGMAFKWVQEVSALVAVTETSVAEYRRFAGNPAHAATNLFTLTTNGWEQRGGSWEHPGFAQSEEHPAVGVSWEDAIKFCDWLTKLEREDQVLAPTQTYTLPTASEWAKLVGGAIFPWETVEAELPRNANYAGREATRQDWPESWPVLGWREDDHWARTAPVRTGPLARSGLYDLAGNAAEWCLEQVLCGGSWFDGEWYAPESNHFDCLKTTHTTVMDPARRDSRNGFRIIIYLGEAPRSVPKP